MHKLNRVLFLMAASLALLFFVGNFAEAAITLQAPPIDRFFQSPTVGGGAILPLTSFMLAQSSGADTLTKVGVQLFASSTISQGEISRISLWKESGATPGFQISQDTFLSGAASSTPMVNGTLIILTPSTAVSVGSSPSEFYVIASTTATAGITNGHGFDLRMQDNFASTSAPSGIGSAFNSGKKVTLNQSATLKISEVKTGSTGNAGDEFVELYNTGETDINLFDLSLNIHTFYPILNGSSSPVVLTYYKKIIPSHGFFLIGNPIGYSGTTPLDAAFATTSFNVFYSNGGVSIATSSAVAAATTTAIDRIAWGTQALANGEGPSLPADLGNDKSYERKATTTSTATTMAPGGIDASKGNGTDLNDNRLDNDGNSTDAGDFVEQSGAGISPQNSSSPVEFPFAGGGGPDMSSPQVMGSYPSDGMTGVPSDFTFIGFGFNKPMSSSTINTTNVTLTTGGGANLCSSVTYNPFPSNFEPAAKCVISALSPSTSYTFTVGTGAQDMSGNSLDQNSFTAGNQAFTATFTTGAAGQTFNNTMPPSVIGTSPFPGSMNIPVNLAKISIEFSSDMKVSTLNNTNITLAAGATNVPISSFSFSTSTGKNILSATVAPASLPLSSNTSHTVTVTTAVQNSNNISLPAQYTSSFTTSSVADNSAPVIVGVLPAAGATILANTSDFIFTFDDNIDSITATSGAVTLSISGGANLPGSVMYNPVAKEGHFIPNNILPIGQSLVLTLKGGSIKNVSGVSLGTDVTKNYTVEAVNSDATTPSILFVNGNEFEIAITFNEAVNSTDVTTLANYSLTVGGVAQTLSALAGNNLWYDSQTRTVKLSGIHVTPAAAFAITAQNIKDMSGNTMTSSSFNGTISSSGAGGFTGPGFAGSTFGEQKDFSASGIGFMPPVEIHPTSNFINASSTYNFSLPIAKQIDADGTIVITFPSTADFSICCAATTSPSNPFMTSQNSDVNGPGTGTIGIKTIARNATAKTVTLTLDAATRSELFNGVTDTHDFLKFGLADIKNPSIPKGIDTSGYSIDIKSKKADGTLLESFSANPVYIGGGSSGGGATTTVRGKATGNGGNLVNMKVHMMSPQTGLLDATTDTSGDYQFTDIPVGSQMLTNNFGGGGQFFLFTDPIISGINDSNGATTTAFFGESMPTPITATSTSIITRNFALTATSSAVNINVKMTASSSTFGASEQVDIFAGGPGQFIVRTVTPTNGTLTATLLTTIPIPQVNGHWGLGIGPAMPKGAGSMMGPPPQVSWSMPKPIDVVISGCPSACLATVNGTAITSYTFTISKADKTISGLLQDASGNAISGAMVFAYSPTGGTGNQGQTSASGAFSVSVTNGSYVVGAFSPGMGQSKETPVIVDTSGNVFVNGSPTVSTGSSGANSFIMKMVKPSYKITGQVTDGTNPVGGASVYAYRTDGPGHADAMTDSSTGNYTIYVDNGAWKVGAFVPGFGPMTEQSVTVSGADKTGINFAPVSGTALSILSGTVYEDLNSDNVFATSTEGISGAVIRVSGSSGVNEGVSGSDGSFSIRVPSGTGYTISDIFHPSYGRIAPLDSAGVAIGTINLTASTTKYIRVPVRRTVTVNIKDSSGNLLVVPKAFIDLFDTTRKAGIHAEITNASSTTIQVPDGASSTIRAFIQGMPSSNLSIAAVNGSTLVLGGVLEVNGNEGINITVDTTSKPIWTVSGTVYKTAATAGNELADAWVEFIDDANGIHVGTQTTSSGTYSLKLANGTYHATAMKPGYVGTPASITIGADITQNFVLNQSDLTISGQVTAGGSATKDAFVRAEKAGGGQVIGKTDTAGNYSLNVTSGTWRVYATAEGYAQAGYSSNPVIVTNSSQSSINVALTTASSLQTKLATSNTFTDTASATFNDSTVGVNIQLDSGTLGSAGNSAYMTARETSNIPDTASVNIIGGKAKDISAYSGSTQIKNLQSGKSATVELTYTKDELTTAGITSTTEVGKLNIAAYSDDKQDWESLSTTATYKDSSGNPIASPSSDLTGVSSVTFAALGTHFSPYALAEATGINPPDVPSGVSATAGASGSGQITLGWNAVSAATGYYIYRDTSSTGSFPLLVDAGNVTSYANTGITAGTTYYYKVSAYKNTGSPESAASSAVNTVVAASSGGTVAGVSTRSTISSSSSSVASSVSSSKSSAPISVAVVAKASPVAYSVSPVFNKDLAKGSKGEDVRRLQQLLASDKDIYPEGIVSGVFGSLTENAVKRFQAKYKLIEGGVVGTATRIALGIVFSGETSSIAAASQTPTESSGVNTTSTASIQLNKYLKKGMTDDQVTVLQQLLSKDSEIYPEGTISGYYGPLTEKAVQRFQEKYGVAGAGEAGYGVIGPKTRAKLAEIFGEESSSSASSAQNQSSVSRSTLSTSTVGTVTIYLKKGMTDDQVTVLQQLLSKDSEIYPEGTISGYYGPLTEKAVQRFQEKYGIAGPDDKGYGSVGPKTRARLSEIFGSI